MSCITKEEFEKYFTTIDKEATKEMLAEMLHRRPKFSIWDIKAEDITTLIKDIKSKVGYEIASIPTVLDNMTKVRMKRLFWEGNREVLNESFYDIFSNDVNVKENIITMKHIIDSISSELAKVDREGLDVNSIVNKETGTVNIPLARLATVIGREIAYTQGIATKENGKLTKEEAAYREMLYYKIGIEQIERLERQGIVKTGELPVVNDFYSEETKGKVNVTNMPSVSLVLDRSMFNAGEIADFKKALFKGYNELIGNKLYTALNSTINPLSRLVRETLITYPPKEKPSAKELAKGDYMKVTNLNKLFRDIMETVDLKLDKSFTDMLLTLAREYENNMDKPFSTFIRESNLPEVANIAKVLGLHDTHSKANKTSTLGQNVSMMSPVESAVNWLIDQKLEEGSYPEEIKWFPTYAFVRNARLHDLNSFLNAQLEKFVRGAIRLGDPVTIEKGSIAEQVMYAGIEEVLDVTKDGQTAEQAITELVNTIKDLDKNNKDDIFYIKGFVNAIVEEKATERALLDKIARLINTGKAFKGQMPTEVYKALIGIADLVKAKDENTINTTFNVEPDATASGFSIMIMQKLNTANPEQRAALIELAKGLGIFKRDKDTKTVRDPYQLAEEGIKRILNNETKSNTELDFLDEIDSELNEDTDIENKKEKLKDLLDSGIFRNLRDIAKIPTVSLIYQQSKSGARSSIAKDIADTLITALEKGDVEGRKKANKYVTKLLENEHLPENYNPLEDSALKRKLIKVLKSKGHIPEILYSIIEEEAKGKYFESFDERTKAMFDVAKNLSTKFNIPLKILPALTAIDFRNGRRRADFKDLMQYGIPLMKRNNVIEEVTDENGNPYQVMRVEEVPLFTTFGTLTTHSTDEAILAKATIATKKRVGKDFNIYGIQDAIIADPNIAAIFQEEYIKATKDVLLDYDTKEELLKSMELMVAEIESRKLEEKDKESLKAAKTFINNIKQEIAEGKTQKQTLIDSMFDEDSSYLFGFEVEAKPKKVKTKKIHKAKSRSGLSKWMEKLKDESEFIRRVGYEGLLPEFKVDPNMSEDAKYDPTTDTVYVKDKKLLTKEVIEHEIAHAIVSGYINERATKTNFHEVHNVRNSKDINLHHITVALDLLTKTMSDDNRMQHIKSYEKVQDQINEFVTLYTTDKDFRDKVNNRLTKHTEKSNKKRLGDSLIAYLTNIAFRLRAVLKAFMKGDFKNYTESTKYKKDIMFKTKNGEEVFNLSPDLLAKSVSSTINKGFLYRAVSSKTSNGSVMYKDKKVDEIYKDDHQNYTPKKRVDDRIEQATLIRANEAIRAAFVNKGEALSVKALKEIHKKLKNKFPVYATAFDKVMELYEENTPLQKILHYTNIKPLADSKTKNELLSLYQNIIEDSSRMIDEGMVRFEEATKNLTKEEKSLLDKTVNKVPLHSYYDLPINVRNKPIEEALDMYSNDFNRREFGLLDEIAEVVVNKKVGKNLVYNTYELFGDNHNAEAVVTLLSIKKLAEKEKTTTDNIKQLLEHKDLKNILSDNALALRSYTHKVHNNKGNTKSLRYVHQTFNRKVAKEKIETKVITRDELDNYDLIEENGWKVLRKPTDTTIGIIYRKVYDDVTTKGIGTDIRYNQQDVYVPDHIIMKYKRNLEANNVVTINRESKKERKFKIVLTEEEENTLGYMTDAKDVVIRSTQHMATANDTIVIRDRLLEESLTMKIGSLNDPRLNNLLNLIKAQDIDHPYFIKLGTDLHYEDLPKEVKQKYILKPKVLSNVQNFNENVTLVRKDISYWLLGEKQDSIFKSEKLRITSKVFKHIVSSAKLGMVIANPKKIGADIISNNEYLATMGVPVTKIAQYGHRIMKEMGTLDEVRLDMVLKRYKYNILRESSGFTTEEIRKAEKEYLEARDRFDNHPMANAVKNGFINSISSDVINNSYTETISGLQADIETVLQKLLLDKNGNNTLVAKGIMKLAKFGYNLEEVLGGIAKPLGKFESTKIFEERLKTAMEHIAKYKKEDDVVSYVQQFLLSPKSEIVKTGVMMNDLSDIVAKETYYRHLRDVGVSHKEAVVKVIQAFPDYKEEMPIEIKALSDYGILMFPAYWIRIQKVVYNMVKNRLLSFGIGEIAYNALGIEDQSIFNSNIFSKYELINNPFDLVNINAVIPTKLNPL